LKIRLIGKNAYQGLESGDSTSFGQVAQSLGHVIVDSYKDADVTVCVDYLKSSRRELVSSRLSGVKTVLIKQEPYVVIPEHRHENPGGFFDLVLPIGIPGKVTRAYGNTWAVAEDWRTKRIRRFVAITANKWSAVSGQLYTLRRRAYSSLELLDLYGVGWDRPTTKHIEMLGKEIILALNNLVIPSMPKKADMFDVPRNYLGPVKDKLVTLAKYDYALIIENSGHYMSEKLMDSLLAGNLPVYVGAPISSFGIPKQFVIQASPVYESVREKLNQALEMDPNKHRKELKDWISDSSIVAQWRADFSVMRLIREIEDFLKPAL